MKDRAGSHHRLQVLRRTSWEAAANRRRENAGDNQAKAVDADENGQRTPSAALGQDMRQSNRAQQHQGTRPDEGSDHRPALLAQAEVTDGMRELGLLERI